MGKFYIKKDQNEVFVASEANGTWIVNEGVTISSDSDFAFKSSWGNTELILKGTLDHTNQFGSAVALTGLGSGLTIAKTGRISGTDGGVFLDSVDDLFLVNRGRIEASSGAVAKGDDVTMKNFGRIVASETYGIEISGKDGEVFNAQGGLINGNIGLEFENVTAGTTKVVNHGTIKGDNWAISGGDGIDHIVNRGTLIGSVLLGDGNNVFDNRGGKVKGDVVGGADGDIFIIGNAPLNIFEPAGNGYDVIETHISYVVATGSEIENLRALGNKNINLTANDIDNWLSGNSGSNTLKGMGGKDWLLGGKGNDRLTGGGDIDHFIFDEGGDADVVTDFDVDADIIYVQDFYLDGGYAELLTHMKDVDAGVLVKIGSDSFLLKGMEMQDMEMSHFHFANL